MIMTYNGSRVKINIPHYVSIDYETILQISKFMKRFEQKNELLGISKDILCEPTELMFCNYGSYSISKPTHLSRLIFPIDRIKLRNAYLEYKCKKELSPHDKFATKEDLDIFLNLEKKLKCELFSYHYMFEKFVPDKFIGLGNLLESNESGYYQYMFYYWLGEDFNLLKSKISNPVIKIFPSSKFSSYYEA